MAAAAFGAATLGLASCGDGRAPAVTERGSPATIPAFGITAWQANRVSRAEFALIHRSGARLYRFNMLTSTTGDRHPRPPVIYDRLMARAAAEGIEFLPVLMRSRPKPGEPSKQVAEPPRTQREWGRWGERVRGYVARYGPGGSFWRARPGLPYLPVRAWEVWNEPNLPQFWGDRKPHPRRYARLLRATRSAIRAVDPHARVLSAGLAWRYDGASYLEAVLAEAGGCSVDAIGIHPYARTATRALRDLSRARDIAAAHGARAAPLWVTEIGWKVGGGGHSAVSDERAQAAQTARYAELLTRRRRELNVGPSIAFALRDRVNPWTGRVNHAGGLRRADGSPRPSWSVWSRWASQGPPLPLPPVRHCGR